MGFITTIGILQKLSSNISFVPELDPPVTVSPIVTPILDITPFANPTDNIVSSVNFGQSTGVNTTATYVAPTNVDFYLTSFYFQLYRATDDTMPHPTLSFDVTINGVVQSLIVQYIGSSLVPPNNPNYYYQLKNPIKVDRGSNVILDMDFTNSHNAATTLTSGVTGFTFNSANSGLQQANYTG